MSRAWTGLLRHKQVQLARSTSNPDPFFAEPASVYVPDSTTGAVPEDVARLVELTASHP